MWTLFGVVLLTILNSTITFASDEQHNLTCCESWITDGWYQLGTEKSKLVSCTPDGSLHSELRTQDLIKVDFQPKNESSFIDIRFCDIPGRQCLVCHIFGRSTGRLGYHWKNMSITVETGNLLQRVPPVERGYESTGGVSWGPDGKTTYEIYIERTSNDLVEIRFDGNEPKQQKELVLLVPQRYSKTVIAASDDESTTYAEGSIDCVDLKRIMFEPAQDLLVRYIAPVGTLGFSLCTDIGQTDCYVFEIDGYNRGHLSFFLRNHSTDETNGTYGWVPGKKHKLPGVLLDRKNLPHDSERSSSYVVEGQNLVIFYFRLHRQLNGSLDVTLYVKDPYPMPKLSINVPPTFKYGAVETNGVSISEFNEGRGRISVHGPCYDGETVGFLSQTCKYKIPLEAKEEEFLSIVQARSLTSVVSSKIWSPSSGRTKAEMTSPIIDLAPNRQQICISIVGLVSQEAAIVVAVQDAARNERPYQLGTLTYNNIFPLQWQKARLMKNLPPALRNVPLVLRVGSKRSTGSIALLKDVQMCAYDGCGFSTPVITPYIMSGRKADSAQYPWHVGIFRKDGDTILYNYICGGSIIRQDVVLSAAHCFYKNGVPLKKELFKLAVGKKYSTLYTVEPFQQFSHAIELHIPERFNGADTAFIHDIAVIRVNFSMSSIISPVCIDLSGRVLKPLQDGDIGKVPGWGKTENADISSELLFASLPYVNYNSCIAGVPFSFRRYVTPDKFCAGYIKGQTLNKGDSGGGLVFNNNGYWYIRGIVSTGIPSALTYTTFTDVFEFLPWIKEVLNIE